MLDAGCTVELVSRIRGWTFWWLPEQKFQNPYIDATRDIQNQDQQLAVRRMELYEKSSSKTASKEEKETARAEAKELSRREHELDARKVPIMLQLMQEHPVDKAWIELLYDLAMQVRYVEGFSHRDEVVALYNNLSETDKKTEKGKGITVYLFPPVTVKIGDEMADADLYDLDGWKDSPFGRL